MCTNEQFSGVQTNHEPNTLSSGKLCIFLDSGFHPIALKNVSSRVMSHDHLSLSLLSFHIWLIIFFLKSSGLTFHDIFLFSWGGLFHPFI
jgi:hypothetical protein